jgi:hypothetical protein
MPLIERESTARQNNGENQEVMEIMPEEPALPSIMTIGLPAVKETP